MPLTVVIAPDSFKGSLGARAAAEAIAEGWRSVRAHDELHLVPQADGGEGTADAVEAAVPGSVRHAAGAVTGPDGRSVEGEWLELPDATALVELATSSGLPLMASLDPLGATTRGLGETILAALDAGATKLIIALGGSASTDAGAGALAALGLGLLDEQGEFVADGGGRLGDILTIDCSGLRPAPTTVTLLTDVTAPLLGPTGAAAIFGPQKGATPHQVEQLERALSQFAQLLGGAPAAAGSGAAGGTAFGLATVWGAVIEPGAEYLARLTGLDALIERADLVLTGEGHFDEQSLMGKGVGRILERAGSKAGVIAGRVSATAPWTASLIDLAGSAQAAMTDPQRWLREAGAKAAREL